MNVWLMPSAFHPHRGGVEEATRQLARFLQRTGHEVRILTNRHPDDLPERERVDGVAVERMPFAAPRMSVRATVGFGVHSARTLRRMTRLRPRPDIVHVNCASTQLTFATAYAQITPSALVLSAHGELEVDADRIYDVSSYARMSLRLGARAADAITACSSWTAARAAERVPLFEQAIVIPNGVDLSDWESTPPPEAPVVAAWGRHVRQKGFDLLLDAWPLVLQMLPSAQLLLGGEGTETEALAARGTQNVRFLGPLGRADVKALLRRCRVAVIPSRIEPFGIVALEAMASGRTPVWSSRGGLSEATGGLGRPVDPYDRPALADSIVQALRSPCDHRRLREHAERYAWDVQGDRYVRLYEATLACKRRGKRLRDSSADRIAA